MTDRIVLSLDWGHSDDTTAVFDGKKIRKKLPKAKTAAGKNMMIVTENMPVLKARSYSQAGVPIFQINTWDVKLERQRQGLPKTHDNDARIIYWLYQNHPEKFRPFEFDQHLFELRSAYAAFKDASNDRTRAKNRHKAYLTEHSRMRWKHTDQLVKQATEELKRQLETWPIYTEFLSKIQGFGPALAAALISATGNINRFANVSSMMAYFGLHVVDGKAPRCKKGQIANWNHRVRSALLGEFGLALFSKTDFVFDQLKDNPYVKVFLTERERQKKLLPKTRPDLKTEDEVNAQAYKMARRAGVKSFVKDYFKIYKRLVNDNQSSCDVSVPLFDLNLVKKKTVREKKSEGKPKTRKRRKAA